MLERISCEWRSADKACYVNAHIENGATHKESTLLSVAEKTRALRRRAQNLLLMPRKAGVPHCRLNREISRPEVPHMVRTTMFLLELLLTDSVTWGLLRRPQNLNQKKKRTGEVRWRG